MPTPREVLGWDVDGLQGVSDRASQIADVIFDMAGRLHATVHDDLAWTGDARVTAGDKADAELRQMRAIGTAYDNLATACREASTGMSFPLAEIKSVLRNYVVPPVSVSDDWTISGVADWDSEAGTSLMRLGPLLDSLLEADGAAAIKISAANEELRALAPASAIDVDRAVDARSDPERMRTSAAAFAQLFGRSPTSPTDWATAEVLNPQSFDPKYQGLGPSIRVVRIEPVPGEGIVRAAQFIEQRDATNPFMFDDGYGPAKRNMGDDRGTDPNFDPEHSRVTTYIDYENGVVVMRQNPSLVQNSDGSPGEVRVGIPEGDVTQNSNGAVRIRYEASDPFEPDLLKNAGFTVNGDLSFTPDSGVRVDGVRSAYPTMEVYQDRPDDTDTQTVLVDRAQHGNSFATTDLAFDHEIGFGRVGLNAYAESWNYEYDVPGSYLPSTDFGTTDEAPVVPAPPERKRSGIPA